MSTSDIQKTQQAALHATLWSMANDLRGAMEAYEFKSYILGLIFFRYLSEKVEKQAAEFLQYDNISFEDFWKDADEEIKQRKHIAILKGIQEIKLNIFLLVFLLL